MERTGAGLRLGNGRTLRTSPALHSHHACAALIRREDHPEAHGLTALWDGADGLWVSPEDLPEDFAEMLLNMLSTTPDNTQLPEPTRCAYC